MVIAAETFLELVRSRRTVRRFRSDAVSRELLGTLLEAAVWAPSAGNRQDWHFTVVTSETTRREMARRVQGRWKAIVDSCRGGALQDEIERYAKNFDWFGAAPAVVAVSAKRAESFVTHLLGDSTAEVVAGSRASAAMAAQNILLAAHSLGLAGCCLTGPLAAGQELGRLLELDRRKELVCLIALGYPAEMPPPPSRRPMEEVARFVE